MRHLADEPERGVARQASIGIERDHILHILRHLRRAATDGHEGGIVRSAQQPVELMQLAALALPSHPFAFARIEPAMTVQQEEAVARRAGTVAPIQLLDPLRGEFQ